MSGVVDLSSWHSIHIPLSPRILPCRADERCVSCTRPDRNIAVRAASLMRPHPSVSFSLEVTPYSGIIIKYPNNSDARRRQLTIVYIHDILLGELQNWDRGRETQRPSCRPF